MPDARFSAASEAVIDTQDLGNGLGLERGTNMSQFNNFAVTSSHESTFDRAEHMVSLVAGYAALAVAILALGSVIL